MFVHYSYWTLKYLYASTIRYIVTISILNHIQLHKLIRILYCENSILFFVHHLSNRVTQHISFFRTSGTFSYNTFLHPKHHNTVFTTLTHIQSNSVSLNMYLYNIPLVYIIHNELSTIDERYAALTICESTAQLVPKHVVGAQLRDGVLTIRLKSVDARVHLADNMKCSKL